MQDEIDTARDRSILACAGEPARADPYLRKSAVYPRVCGGARIAVRVNRLAVGLSPRVRGSQPQSHSETSVGRSIPACAGEPAEFPCSASLSSVYPRVCGGAGQVVALDIFDVGLSPRVRGSRGGGGALFV